jgi:hypothetical protein
MAVEEVDMALPAGAWRAQEPEEKTWTLQQAAIADHIRKALRQRRRFAITERQRSKRSSDFDGAVKLLVKRLAADVASDVTSGRVNEGVRLRMYSAIMVLVSALDEERAREALRVRRMLSWLPALMLMGAGVVVGILWRIGWVVVP